MSKIALTGNASGTGTLTIAAPNTSTDRTLTLPDQTGTIITTAGGAAISGTTGTFTGLVDISAAGAGHIQFPATQNASGNANTLDDYEEGTWTPYYSPGGASFSSITYSGDTGGRYVKIGRMVYCSFFIQVTAFSGGSGNLTLQGFPFSAASVSNQGITTAIGLAGSWGANTPFSIDGAGGGTGVNIKYRSSSNGSIDSGNIAVSDLATNCFMRTNLCYLASA